MESKLVICMKWGKRYDTEYVNRLYRSCKRHMYAPLQFLCFTDDARSLVRGIDARPLPKFDGVSDVLSSTTWRKLSLWQRDLGDDLTGRDALVLDLDIVITGSLRDFWTFQPGNYAVIENWTTKGRGIGNTSVYRLRIGQYPQIYEDFVAAPIMSWRKYRTEQVYISQRIAGLVFWPKTWCRSFKGELLPAWPMRLWRNVPLPSDARIVVFHGKPDPHEAIVGIWPNRYRLEKIYRTFRPVSWISEHWT
jgi:hypothetical protein